MGQTTGYVVRIDTLLRSCWHVLTILILESDEEDFEGPGETHLTRVMKE